jgi:hypothetical protein
MLMKIVGIVLIVLGGFGALGVLLPLIGSIFGLAFLALKLAIPLVMLVCGRAARSKG